MTSVKEIESALEIDPVEVGKRIVGFVQEKIEESGASGLVLGISGGLDSAATAYLCAKALDKEDVLGISLPEKNITGENNRRDAKKLAKNIGIEFKEIEISPIIKRFKEQIEFDEDAKLANANLRPRTRMVILYYYANLLNYLVVGTGNKSELKCGYFTKFGDGAADILPMGNLYKTQVREIAEFLGVPSEIIEKKPSANLWKGQKDENELGFPYEKIDRIYTGLEKGIDGRKISEYLDVKESTVEKFEILERKSKHKIKIPPSPKIYE